MFQESVIFLLEIDLRCIIDPVFAGYHTKRPILMDFVIQTLRYDVTIWPSWLPTSDYKRVVTCVVTRMEMCQDGEKFHYFDC